MKMETMIFLVVSMSVLLFGAVMQVGADEVQINDNLKIKKTELEGYKEKVRWESGKRNMYGRQLSETEIEDLAKWDAFMEKEREKFNEELMKKAAKGGTGRWCG